MSGKNDYVWGIFIGQAHVIPLGYTLKYGHLNNQDTCPVLHIKR